ncbi:polysaccharide export protein [Cellulophaga baltica]|uniref:polysaccharide biosynthesis/export family protein n=1 Tax=Cellulophaga TaxID=104264 RepID=UPI001C07E05E|nr:MULTISPECIES: polysaccharide biosynthesis/export family protein [Cellulophaga]MBU2996754.1 polysaccharide export protein [Cellulophaga baltica]MDO6768150.1 polysaccharide biosynthesis/export family protein [Cellulophaga sp. 1_MG-2023]
MNKFFSFLIIVIFLSSCGSKKDVVYFQDSPDFETIVNESKNVNKFKVDDVVEINVSTLNDLASKPFNLYKGSETVGTRPEQLDYIIDNQGNIDFPVLGAVNIVGLTSEEAKIKIKTLLEEYIKDPIVNIRLKNFTVTILGEVSRPGTYPVNGEQITVLEALGLAGDMTIKGKRENVLVIREFQGTKVSTRINLLSKDFLNSPVYYLTQNDVIYVEPNKSAITSAQLDNRASIAISIASVLITSTVLILVN